MKRLFTFLILLLLIQSGCTPVEQNFGKSSPQIVDQWEAPFPEEFAGRKTFKEIIAYFQDQEPVLTTQNTRDKTYKSIWRSEFTSLNIRIDRRLVARPKPLVQIVEGEVSCGYKEYIVVFDNKSNKVVSGRREWKLICCSPFSEKFDGEPSMEEVSLTLSQLNHCEAHRPACKPCR